MDLSNIDNKINETHQEMENIEFSTYWTLWFHKIDDNNWLIDSYQKLYEIHTVKDYCELINTIPTYESGMFFLMKEDIPPIWETGKNIGGGMWTFKVSKKKLDELWTDLIAHALGNTLTKEAEEMNNINGISISPKINNCIVKIWNSDENNNDSNLLNPEIENGEDFLIEECKYRSHPKKNKDKKK